MEDSQITSLVESLNQLLQALDLPLTLVSPLDLTPSLLLAILESILRERLPLPPELRACRTRPVQVKAMKLFLGILGDDVLGEDLGDVDPRYLADGEWDEVVYIGQLLCDLGRQRGLYDGAQRERRSAESARTPSPVETVASTNAHTVVSHFSAPSEATETTFLPSASSLHAERPPAMPTPRPTIPKAVSPPQPRCIHEVPEPSIADTSRDLCDCSLQLDGDKSIATTVSSCHCAASQPVPVRHRGYIKLVEGDVEAFEARRDSLRKQKASIDHSPSIKSDHSYLRTTPHVSPARHTLALMNERARLLRELARKETSEPS